MIVMEAQDIIKATVVAAITIMAVPVVEDTTDTEVILIETIAEEGVATSW